MYVWKYQSIPPPPSWTARQQPRDWVSLFNFSESDQGMGGAQLLLFNFATRLHGICNGSDNGMNPTALGLGISAPPPLFFEDLFTSTQKH